MHFVEVSGTCGPRSVWHLWSPVVLCGLWFLWFSCGWTLCKGPATVLALAPGLCRGIWATLWAEKRNGRAPRYERMAGVVPRLPPPHLGPGARET